MILADAANAAGNWGCWLYLTIIFCTMLVCRAAIEISENYAFRRGLDEEEEDES